MNENDIIITMRNDFIERCSAARRSAKVTLKDIALELGYTPENIRKFEKGLNNSLILAFYYIHRFGVEVD